MEEIKKRQSGTKVSKIANIFQGMPSREDEEVRGSDVTGVRTESHLARFNNARALFEKLGEENRGFRIEKSPSAAASFAGTRGVTPPAPARSRSSSAGSVSPPRRIVTPTPMPPPAVNGDRIANGAAQPPPKPAKPSVLPKPEKPDRRFNKELIEKQRNWTAHFNKSRQSRNDETKLDSNKYSSGYPDRKSPEAPERYVVPSRVYSPPLSPCAGDSQAERPTTLPSSLVNRVAPNVKTPSPIKSATPVSPLSRPNSSVSPVPRTEALVSPNVRRENYSSPNQTNVDIISEEPSEKCHANLRTSVSPSEEHETHENKANSDSQVTKSSEPTPPLSSKTVERISTTPPSPSLTPTTLEPVLTPRTQKSPSPSARSARPQKSPVSPLCHETESLLSAERESSMSPLPNDRASTPSSENITDAVAHNDGYSPSLTSHESPVPSQSHDSETKNVCDRISPSRESPVPLDNLAIPTKKVDEDGYESIDYSEEWEEKNRRRSSTPEPPACPVKAEVPRSPLVSPLASPVHRNTDSSQPASLQASPSPGMSLLCYYFKPRLPIIHVGTD